jgi:hypothetical protein
MLQGHVLGCFPNKMMLIKPQKHLSPYLKYILASLSVLTKILRSYYHFNVAVPSNTKG